MKSAWAVVSSISTMRSGQSSRGDRHGENSTTEMLHSHPTRRRLLSRPVLSIHGAVTCLPSTTATTTTCPFFCEHTNPILTLSILLPTYYSTLIPTPHHSSLLPAACLPFTSATSHPPSAHALAVNFNPSKPSTQLDLLTPKTPLPSPSTILCIQPSTATTPPLFYHTTRRVRQRTSSLVLVSYIPAVCTLPLAPVETARDETLPAWKPSRSDAPTIFRIPVYTIAQHRGTTLLAALPYHTICHRESWPQAQTCLTAPSPPMA
jgi:hypothetical protein